MDWFQTELWLPESSSTIHNITGHSQTNEQKSDIDGVPNGNGFQNDFSDYSQPIQSWSDNQSTGELIS